ncbi:MAG: hypothetical protein SGI89_09140 [bacterium]|nr:hypothetical protein [bacterium]
MDKIKLYHISETPGIKEFAPKPSLKNLAIEISAYSLQFSIIRMRNSTDRSG